MRPARASPLWLVAGPRRTLGAMTADTHAAFVRLTGAGFSDEQSDEQAEAILASGHDFQAPLATKTDLTELRTELKGDLAELRSELKAGMAALGLRLTLRAGAGLVLAVGVLGTLIAIL